MLTQVSTRGIANNHAPIASTKVIPAVAGRPELHIPIFRFYLDGLIAHMHDVSGHADEMDELGALAVGNAKEIVLGTVTFETSIHAQNLKFIMQHAEKTWPGSTN